MSPPADADDHARWLAGLLDTHGGPLAAYAAQWTTSADDCVQEALIELAGVDPPPRHPAAWLYRVVKHRALNHARGERRRGRREQLAWQARLQSGVAGDDRRDLLDAVAALPELEREVTILRIWGGLTFEEIATVLGQSSSTLHRRYTQAIESLRQQWEAPCERTTETK